MNLQHNNTKLLTITNIIILSNFIIFGIQNQIESLTTLLGLNILFFQYNFYYQLFSTMFIHGGIAHILMNMLVLFQFGTTIESHLGKVKYILLYFLGGTLTSIGTLVYMYYTNSWVNVIGASGAISVLLGWFALKNNIQRNGIIVWVILISFAPLLLGLPIAWYSHLIGFALGWLLGYII